MLSEMISPSSATLFLVALATFVYTESQFELGFLICILITLFLFASRFFVIPFLLLTLNLSGLFLAQEYLSYVTAGLLLIHLLFSNSRQKMLQKTISHTKERIIVVESGEENNPELSSGKVLADAAVESTVAVSKIVLDTEGNNGLSFSDQSPDNADTFTLVKRKPKSKDQSLIEAAKEEARKAEEERMKEVIENRLLSPKEKAK